MTKKLVLLLILALSHLSAFAVVATTNRTVIVAWDPNPSADQVTNYTLYAAPTSNGVYTAISSVVGSVTNTVLTNLVAQERWYYLTAKNFWGLESDPSEKVHTPDAPTQIQGLGVLRIPTGIQLTWSNSPPAEEIRNYRVYAGSNVADINSFTLISQPTNNVHQEAMAPGFRAFFVTATNFWGEGFQSAIITVPGLPGAPGQPKLNAN